MTQSPDDENSEGKGTQASAPDFTPGPWQLIASAPERDGADCWTLLAQPHPSLRGFTKELAILAGPQADENAIANARLIASAPDLYEALKKIETLTLVTGAGRADQVIALIKERVRAALLRSTGGEG